MADAMLASEDNDYVVDRRPDTVMSEGHSPDLGGLVDTENRVPQRQTGNDKRRKSRSKYVMLEEKFEQKHNELQQSVDKMFKMVEFLATKAQNTSQEKAESQRPAVPVIPQRSPCDSGDDCISLQPGQNEKIIDSDSDSESELSTASDFPRDEAAKKALFDIFGQDAIVKQEPKHEGLLIDKSQREVLDLSWRSSKPNSVTAFAEENLDLFPLDEKTEKYLDVPSIDPLVESALIKRHGSKASFSKGNKGSTLFSQPCKMIEKMAYRGQQAARLGIVMQLYTQQSLGCLLQSVQGDDFDADKVTKQIKDIFSISTKCLDQLGRTGAFHHVIRRAMSITDTCWYELDDSEKFVNLPLTSEGIFGAGLDKLLKERKEKKKQVEDLLPEIRSKQSAKRSYSSSNTQGPSNSKRGRFDFDRRDSRVYESRRSESGPSSQPSVTDTFRIPKISKSHNTGQSQEAQGRTRAGSYVRGGFRGRGSRFRR